MENLFIDPIGRISEKPKTYAQGITDNPLLFTGEYLFLKKKLGQLTSDDKLLASVTLIESEVACGLYRRHNQDFQTRYNVPYNHVSHDEYVGIFLLCHVNNLHYRMVEVCNYGKRNYWQFNCLAPNKNFWDYFKKNPIKAVKEFKEYKRQYKAKPEDTNSVDANFPIQEVVSLNFQRQPRDIAFYELMTYGKTSLFNLLNLCLSTLLTTRRSLDDGKRGGTILLALFRIELLNEYEMPKMLQHTRKLFRLILRKKYGKNFAQVIAKRYFDLKGDNGETHPIIEMIEILNQD
jgi:hypothetical protein